jgi:ElaB protein
MELYFKDLISDDASLEKLVDDLAIGADHFAQSVGAGISEQSRREVANCLDRLKESCDRLKENAIAGAHATDKIVRENPYWSLGIVAAAALVVGWKLGGRK